MEYINYKLVVDDKDVLGYLRELEGKGLFNMPTYSPSGTETSFGNLFNGDDKMVSLERFTHLFHTFAYIISPGKKVTH